MKPSQEVAPLLEPLAAIQRVLDRFNDQGLIIGGVAASLLGKPRLTADVDALILLSIDSIPDLIEVAKQEGLVPRLSDAEDFAQRQRVLLLQHAESNINVDISLGMLPFEVEAVERGQVYQVSSIAIRLPTPEDLIILKAVAHRPKDMLDIEAIIASQPNLDKDHIKLWMTEFAQLLEMPELWEDVAVLLKSN